MSASLRFDGVRDVGHRSEGRDPMTLVLLLHIIVQRGILRTDLL
ncbi:MAG: hypothetical protein OSB26_15510 [Woeseiaceae bacterium]|nr:hypothetical protein [Woeseiaceae bacterium]